MSALVLFVLLDALFLAGWSAVRAVRGRSPGVGLAAGLVLLELTLVAEVIVDLLDGRRAVQPAVHAGYLAAAVLLLPLIVLVTRDDGDRGREWGTAAIAVACLALAVVQIRIVGTGPPA